MTRTCQDRPFGNGPVELVDCERHGAGSGAELFIVEGESAALAVARVRDPRVQAVLPMQGKPLNATKATARRVTAQPLYRALAAATGTGMGGAFRREGLRYERILLLTDPDADGIHCGVLLAGFFLEWMRPLLEQGLVGWVRPPWGEVVGAGEAPRIGLSEEELSGLSAAARERGPVVVRRFRGLAAIDERLLAARCLDPAGRRVDPLGVRAVEAMVRLLAEAIPEGSGEAGGGADPPSIH